MFRMQSEGSFTDTSQGQVLRTLIVSKFEVAIDISRKMLEGNTHCTLPPVTDK